MLLSLMRKHAKSWIIKFLIAVIAIVFIFYFGYSFKGREGLKIAYVNGELITGADYQKGYYEMLEGLQRQYKGAWNDNLIKVFDLKNKALDNLINQKLISQEARRLGLDVTEEVVQKSIMDYPAFQTNGRFDLGRYHALLSHNRMKPEDFEAAMARELLQERLKQFLFTFMAVTDNELRDHYTYENEKINVSYVHFAPETFKKDLKPDQADMDTYYEAHKEAYRVPEKIKAAYLTIDPKTYHDQLKATDREIRDYYEYNQTRYAEARKVKARHILFKLAQDASPEDEAKVKEKASLVLEQARQEGADFAELAKEHSEGPTAPKGGDLGYFSEGQMVKAFEEAAFKLKKDEISDLVRTRFGFHIIKAEDVKEARTKPLEEVREDIKADLIGNSATELAHEKGLSLIDQMPYEVDLAQYGKEHDMDIHQSDFFAQTEAIPNIGGTQKLWESLFALEKNEASELMEIDDKFYIFQVAERKDAYIPDLAEVREKVREDVIDDLAAKQAKAAAESYLADMKKGADWDELAKEKGLEPQTTEFFTRLDSVPDVGYDEDLLDGVFHLNEEKRMLDRVYENFRGAFVFRWGERREIDEKKFEEDRERSRLSVMQSKQARAFESWLGVLKEKAEIELITPVT